MMIDSKALQDKIKWLDAHVDDTPVWRAEKTYYEFLSQYLSAMQRLSDVQTQPFKPKRVDSAILRRDKVVYGMLHIKELLNLPYLSTSVHALTIYFFENEPGVRFKDKVSQFARALDQILNDLKLKEDYETVIRYHDNWQDLTKFFNENPKLLTFFHDQLQAGVLQQVNESYRRFLIAHENYKVEPPLLNRWKAAHPEAAASVKVEPPKKVESYSEVNRQMEDKLRRQNSRAEAKKVTAKDLKEIDEDLYKVQSSNGTVQLMLRHTEVGQGMSVSAYDAAVASLQRNQRLVGSEREAAPLVTVSKLQAEIAQVSTPAQRLLASIMEDLRYGGQQLEIKRLQAEKALFQEILKGSAATAATVHALRLAALQAKINYLSLVAAQAKLKVLWLTMIQAEGKIPTQEGKWDGARKLVLQTIAKKAELAALQFVNDDPAVQSTLSSERLVEVRKQIQILSKEIDSAFAGSLLKPDLTVPIPGGFGPHGMKLHAESCVEDYRLAVEKLVDYQAEHTQMSKQEVVSVPMPPPAQEPPPPKVVSVPMPPPAQEPPPPIGSVSTNAATSARATTTNAQYAEQEHIEDDPGDRFQRRRLEL